MKLEFLFDVITSPALPLFNTGKMPKCCKVSDFVQPLQSSYDPLGVTFISGRSKTQDAQLAEFDAENFFRPRGIFLL